jgi:hypothetical protein
MFLMKIKKYRKQTKKITTPYFTVKYFDKCRIFEGIRKVVAAYATSRITNWLHDRLFIVCRGFQVFNIRYETSICECRVAGLYIQASLNIYPSLFPKMQADSKNEEEDEKIEDERTFSRQNFVFQFFFFWVRS